MHRLRRLVLGLTAVALLPALAAFLIAVALHTPWVEAEIRSRVAATLGDALGARVSIGRLQGTLLAGVRARDVRIVYPSGARLIVDEASATYALPALLAGRVLIGTLHLHDVDARLVRTADGWRLTRPERPERPAHGTTPHRRHPPNRPRRRAGGHRRPDRGAAPARRAHAGPPRRRARRGLQRRPGDDHPSGRRATRHRAVATDPARHGRRSSGGTGHPGRRPRAGDPSQPAGGCRPHRGTARVRPRPCRAAVGARAARTVAAAWRWRATSVERSRRAARAAASASAPICAPPRRAPSASSARSTRSPRPCAGARRAGPARSTWPASSPHCRRVASPDVCGATVCSGSPRRCACASSSRPPPSPASASTRPACSGALPRPASSRAAPSRCRRARRPSTGACRGAAISSRTRRTSARTSPTWQPWSPPSRPRAS